MEQTALFTGAGLAAAGAAAGGAASAYLERGWRMPQSSTSLGEIWDKAYPLRITNSLTRTKVPFVPISGKRVLWYMCGPTVYDSSHMGHARTYVSFDILRRIMSQYFGYDVVLTVNVTDIDDKIIKRSAEASIPYLELSRKYEAEFLADMAALGVLPPDALTRVSEYVPEIVAFIQRIIGRGFAYSSNGSVYFDTAAYTASKRHTYGKLVPENVGNTEALAEGEGVLSAPPCSVGISDKRDVNDFVLWKRSKEGEPTWGSPWGPGRPGWHIECSAMCGETLGAFAGGPIDIHSGGVDLRFPHHENEIAQSEAYYDSTQWVNYFVHSGHLHIEGLKMSKSLKNFVKISEALERFGPRQLRLFFLMHRYNAPLNYSENAMEAMEAVEKSFTEFFSNTKAALRRKVRPEDPVKWSSADAEFAAGLQRTRETVRAKLSDDFDTPGAMTALSDLVHDTNKYLNASRLAAAAAAVAAAATQGSVPPPPTTTAAAAAPSLPNLHLLRASADFVSGMFRVFGLIDAMPNIGFSVGSAGDGEASLESVLSPYLDALAGFRQSVRESARAGNLQAVLAACDALRNETMRPLGVVLEDESSAASSGTAAAASAPSAASAGGKWKLRDPAELRKEDEEKRVAAEEKQRQKAAAAAEAARRAAEKEEKARVNPRGMFVEQRDTYSAWDEEGVPTHDAAGAALPPATVKRLKKEWAQQEKLFQWWQEKYGGGQKAPVAAAAASAEGQ